MTNNTLGISNRISVSILSTAIEQYLLSGQLDINYLTEQLRTEYTGELRLKKAVSQIRSIFFENPIFGFVNDHKTELLQALGQNVDRNIIAIAFFAAKSNFCYDTIFHLGKLFHVEDYISSATLTNKLGFKYGNNKNMSNTIYMVVPSLVEAGFFSRPKPGLYKAEDPLRATYPITLQIWKEAFSANNPLFPRDNNDLLSTEPFMQFVKMK